jgi:hypothetical protein
MLLAGLPFDAATDAINRTEAPSDNSGKAP